MRTQKGGYLAYGLKIMKKNHVLAIKTTGLKAYLLIAMCTLAIVFITNCARNSHQLSENQFETNASILDSKNNSLMLQENESLNSQTDSISNAETKSLSDSYPSSDSPKVFKAHVWCVKAGKKVRDVQIRSDMMYVCNSGAPCKIINPNSAILQSVGTGVNEQAFRVTIKKPGGDDYDVWLPYSKYLPGKPGTLAFERYKYTELPCVPDKSYLCKGLIKDVDYAYNKYIDVVEFAESEKKYLIGYIFDVNDPKGANRRGSIPCYAKSIED
jgi:hypothetical protein